ncbi:MAG: hypothetical protein EB168_05500 [Euryarchaeota archaeon]|nr:hypothetical protein [Euryarchaeota archaeon]
MRIIRSLLKVSMLSVKVAIANTMSAPASSSSSSENSKNSIRTLIHSTSSDDYTQFGPVLECLCGSDLFIALVSFGDDREIATYFVDGRCAVCKADVILPTPIDEVMH